MMAVEFITLASAILCSINLPQGTIVCFVRYNLKGLEPAVVELTVLGANFCVHTNYWQLKNTANK
jgi:hypothetical protein